MVKVVCGGLGGDSSDSFVRAGDSYFQIPEVLDLNFARILFPVYLGSLHNSSSVQTELQRAMSCDFDFRSLQNPKTVLPVSSFRRQRTKFVASVAFHTWNSQRSNYSHSSFRCSLVRDNPPLNHCVKVHVGIERIN